MKLGPHGTILLAIVLAASAVGILTPTLSNTEQRTTQVNGQAFTLTVDGIPETVAPGGLFRVVATMANNANRPVAGVLRMEVRNPNGTIPDELTVYAGCGAEEIVSSRTLRYYIGWNGPLVAAKGVSYAAGTTVATIVAGIGTADYWVAVLHEAQVRDPQGYESLISPGLNASAGVRNSGSDVLRAMNYYGMVHSSSENSTNLADWTLTVPFTDHFVASGDGSQNGFLVEIHPASRGSFEFKLWVELPDGLGIPSHPSYTCGPL
jgi:hypothetical protein